MSRYRFNPEKQEEKTIEEVYGDRLGYFFLLITIKDFAAQIKTCGDTAVGITATADMLYNLCKRSGLSKEHVFDIINKVWEEHDINESNDN